MFNLKSILLIVFILFISSVYGKVKNLKKKISNNISTAEFKKSIARTNNTNLLLSKSEREERIKDLKQKIGFLKRLLSLKYQDPERYYGLLKELYNQADKSQDGRVDYTEFVEYFARSLKNSASSNSEMFDQFSGEDKSIDDKEFEVLVEYFSQAELYRSERELAYLEYQQEIEASS